MTFDLVRTALTFGLEILLLAWLSARPDVNRHWLVWNDPPRWARRVFAARRNSVLYETIVLAVLGAAWIVGGAILFVAGTAVPVAKLIVGVLFPSFVCGLGLAIVTRLIRGRPSRGD